MNKSQSNRKIDLKLKHHKFGLNNLRGSVSETIIVRAMYKSRNITINQMRSIIPLIIVAEGKARVSINE